MSQDWYYSVDGDRQGPVTAADLKKLADAGTLKATDLVWKDGMTDWAPAKSVKGLFAAGSSPSTAKADAAPAKAAPRDAEDDDRPSVRGRLEGLKGRAVEDDRPARRRRDEDADDEDDRPSRRKAAEDDDRPSSRRRDAEDDDRPVRSRGRDDDADDDRPVRRKKGGRVPEDTANKKMVAGLLGILLGGLGVHKFYLGFTSTGVIQLILSIFTCGLVGWLGIIEGIIYLTKSDEDFHREYVVNEKQWF